MPTNEERREVVARLRAKHKERSKPDVWYPQAVGAYEKAYLLDLEACVPDGKSLFAVLADLIEPEPERTCRNVFPKDGILPNLPETMFRCSECGCDVQDYESYGICMTGGKWNFCPNCGAKVVER